MSRRRARPAFPEVPAGLLERIAGQLPPGELPAFRSSLDDAPVVSIRVNPAKHGGPEGVQVPWCTSGRYLNERPVFTLDPLLHAGAYYVQEASSMLVEAAYRTAFPGRGPSMALDLCAAPGGKSTHLRSLLPEGALLVCNEVDARRRAVLAENLWKWGGTNVMLTGSPAADFRAIPGTFGLVLVDAPCSGEGLMRRGPEARRQWSPDLVDRCAIVQQGLLDDAWASLAPGGTLIYSTCTWAPEEDEHQVEALIQRTGAMPLEVQVPTDSGFTRAGHGLRAWPHRVLGEGFFLAALRKPGVCEQEGAEDLEVGVLEHEERAWLIDERMRNEVHRLLRLLRVDAPGTPLWTRDRDRTAPQAAAALCPAAARLTIDHLQAGVLAVDEAEALAFLRGEVLRSGEARGPALVEHRGLGLGWVHGAGGRWNNGHPKPWRIRMR